MDPITSKSRGYDLSYVGIHPIWTGLGVPTEASPSSSIPSGSTLASDLPFVQPISRGTVKQGSAAWTSLRGHQPKAGPERITRDDNVSEPVDANLTAAIHSINKRRTDSGHIGAPGKHQLPETQREAARRMILAVCGERNEPGGGEEIARCVERSGNQES